MHCVFRREALPKGGRIRIVVGVGIGVAVSSDAVPVGVGVSAAGAAGEGEAEVSGIGVESDVAAQSAIEARRSDKSTSLVEIAVVDCGIVTVAPSLAVGSYEACTAATKIGSWPTDGVKWRAVLSVWYQNSILEPGMLVQILTGI
jgi:hypothetical protein